MPDQFPLSDMLFRVAPATGSDNLNDVAPLAELEHENFPHITFWFRSDWPSKRVDTDSKVFVETEDGEIVSGDRMADMCKYARILWDIFQDEGIAPPKWGEASAHLRQRYHRLMCDEFPELRFCDKNWKADYIATLNYPLWYRYWVAQSLNIRKQKTKSRSVSRIFVFHESSSSKYSNL